jgi:hypothetical protein
VAEVCKLFRGDSLAEEDVDIHAHDLPSDDDHGPRLGLVWGLDLIEIIV